MRELLFALLMGVTPVTLAQGLGPEELVRKVTEEVLEAIKSDPQLASGNREKVLKLAEEKVLPHIDFEEAARLAVGRAWNQASPEQRKLIVDQFRSMLVRTYASAISSPRRNCGTSSASC